MREVTLHKDTVVWAIEPAAYDKLRRAELLNGHTVFIAPKGLPDLPVEVFDPTKKDPRKCTHPGCTNNYSPYYGKPLVCREHGKHRRRHPGKGRVCVGLNCKNLGCSSYGAPMVCKNHKNLPKAARLRLKALRSKKPQAKK